jgi:hypothetical protein
MARKARAASAAKRAPEPQSRALRRLDDHFREHRFEPVASKREYVGVVAMSAGCIALGAGVFATWLRSGPGLWYGPWLIAAGIAVCVGAVLFGQTQSTALRVGELGIGFEDESGKVSRTAWYEVVHVALAHDSLRLRTTGRPLTLGLASFPGGARRALAEALARIPTRVELDPADQDQIGEPQAADGEVVPAEPPQVTNLHCRASDQPLTFERDVRMCSRCGVLYHRTAVPRRCIECGKKLKKGA